MADGTTGLVCIVLVVRSPSIAPMPLPPPPTAGEAGGASSPPLACEAEEVGTSTSTLCLRNHARLRFTHMFDARITDYIRTHLGLISFGMQHIVVPPFENSQPATPLILPPSAASIFSPSRLRRFGILAYGLFAYNP